MNVFTCADDVGAMMTCIYEAYASRLGHRNIRLELEPVSQLELFCQYRHIDYDEKKASSVIHSIRKKISLEAWQLIYQTALSWRQDRLDCIYRFLLLGFHYGASVTEMLQHPAVSRLFALSRKVCNEAHLFREFVRFCAAGSNVLVSHIEPKCNILTLIAPHFSDRMPSENWILIDDTRKIAVVQPANQRFYLTNLSDSELERLMRLEKDDGISLLWKEFFHSIAIEQRRNCQCQRTLMPLWYRSHMTEFSHTTDSAP
ncbi:MAG: TIGR03915 family putative DNA repair protein [Ruminococcus sp.]|jgi:probable DNA metabolism protein